MRTGGILDKNDATFVDTFLEKCEATFYESGGGGEKSFEETFAPEVGWEAYLADLKERVS